MQVAVAKPCLSKRRETRGQDQPRPRKQVIEIQHFKIQPRLAAAIRAGIFVHGVKRPFRVVSGNTDKDIQGQLAVNRHGIPERSGYFAAIRHANELIGLAADVAIGGFEPVFDVSALCAIEPTTRRLIVRRARARGQSQGRQAAYDPHSTQMHP